MARQPLDIVECLYINKLVGTQSCQCVECVIPGIREVGCDCGRDLVALKEVHNLMAFSFQIWICVPDRGEAMEVFWIVLAKEIDDKMDAVLGLGLLDFL